MGYSFRLTTMGIIYAPPHRKDSTYHSLCYASRGALAGTSVIRKEGNDLFNDALNTFFNLRLYGVEHMVKDQRRERKPAAHTSQATFFYYQHGVLDMHHRTDRTAHTTAFVTALVSVSLYIYLATNSTHCFINGYLIVGSII